MADIFVLTKKLKVLKGYRLTLTRLPFSPKFIMKGVYYNVVRGFSLLNLPPPTPSYLNYVIYEFLLT